MPPSRSRQSSKSQPLKSSSPGTSRKSSNPNSVKADSIGFNRKETALRRCGVDLKELERAAPIADILGKKHNRPVQVAQMLRSSSSPMAAKFLNYWDELPDQDRIRLSIEEVCVGAKVPTEEFCGVVISALHRRKIQESTVEAIAAHPDVMRATIRSAKLEGKEGFQDRHMLHSMPSIGFLPGPKGSQFQVNLGIMNNPAQTPAASQKGDAIDAQDMSINDVFPPITGVLENWNDDRRKLLKSPEK
jgi:hypothetical protein